MLLYICAEDVFDMLYSLLIFVNIRVILYKTYVVLICGKYNTLTLEFKINIAICVPLHVLIPRRYQTLLFTNDHQLWKHLDSNLCTFVLLILGYLPLSFACLQEKLSWTKVVLKFCHFNSILFTV